MARAYYVLATFKRGVENIIVPVIHRIADKVDSREMVDQLRAEIAAALQVQDNGLIVWIHWPLDKAPQSGRYAYQITCLNLKRPTEMQTNVYHMPIPLDSPEGMQVVTASLRPFVPIFFAELRPNKEAPLSFPEIAFSKN